MTSYLRGFAAAALLDTYPFPLRVLYAPNRVPR